jgi:hypothetical protein
MNLKEEINEMTPLCILHNVAESTQNPLITDAPSLPNRRLVFQMHIKFYFNERRGKF